MLSYFYRKYYLALSLFLLFTLFNRVTFASSVSSDTVRINSLLQSAQNDLEDNKLSESFKAANIALTLAIKNRDDYRIAKSLSFIGQIQSTSGKKDSSIITFKKALSYSKQTDNESQIGEIINSIGRVFYDIGNQDSALFYYDKALEIRQKINDKAGLSRTINNIGLVYNAQGLYSKALENYFISLAQLEEINDKTFQPRVLSNIGIVFWYQGDYKNALEFFFKALKIQEELNDVKSAGYILNNIGLVYQLTGDYDMALKYLNESLRIKESQGDRLGVSFAYTNLGDVYQKKGEFKKAIDFYLKAEVLKKELSNFASLANLYISMGKLYRTMKQPQKSLEILNAAENIYNKVNEPNGIASCLIQKSLTYYELGSKTEAISSCLKGINQAKEIGAIDLIKQGYEYISEMYEKLGQTANAFDSYKLFIVFRDSISSLEKSKEIVRIQMQVEFNQLMQKQKQEQDVRFADVQGKSHKQATISSIFIFAFIIALSLFIFFYINFRLKQRHNNLLSFQKLDMERQRNELTAQRDELEIQKNLVIHQRDKIIMMLTDLGESIDYARKIQQAMLPSDECLERTLGQYFLLFHPRETVGGDFYWVEERDGLIYFAIADCTGHGIPGGFMSMLGVSLLNELIMRSDCASPSKMLWNLRDLIIKALNQTGRDEDSQDGMDIAFCVYNPKDKTLNYAGSNLSLIIITEKPIEANERIFVQDNLVEFRPDRMPVSFYQRMEEYHEHHITLNSGDTIYLFSDGFADQFGGPYNKKYGYATFKNMIALLSKQPFDKQRDIFWNVFEKWKGEENQTDDVLVMGIRFP